jgi:hypothetical protein
LETREDVVGHLEGCERFEEQLDVIGTETVR